MAKLRRLSGREVVRILEGFGFETVSQRGSHVKWKRVVVEGSQVLTVPLHRELDRGTLRGILRQASRFVPEDDLRPHFYHDNG